MRLGSGFSPSPAEALQTTTTTTTSLLPSNQHPQIREGLTDWVNEWRANTSLRVLLRHLPLLLLLPMMMAATTWKHGILIKLTTPQTSLTAAPHTHPEPSPLLLLLLLTLFGVDWAHIYAKDIVCVWTFDAAAADEWWWCQECQKKWGMQTFRGSSIIDRGNILGRIIITSEKTISHSQSTKDRVNKFTIKKDTVMDRNVIVVTYSQVIV